MAGYLLGNSGPRGAGSTATKNVPLRLVCPGRPAFVQAPLSPTGEDATPRTLGDALRLLLPDMAFAEQGAEELCTEGLTRPEVGLVGGEKRYMTLVQGVRPSLDAPLLKVSGVVSCHLMSSQL